jgi:hypothetical protein
MTFDRTKRSVILHERFHRSLLEKHKITAVSSSPATSGLLHINKATDMTPLSHAQQRSLHSTIAKLLYLALHSRPDILFSVNHLTSHVKNLVVVDEDKVIRIQYLAYSRDLTMSLHIPDTWGITMTLFADASFGIHEKKRSHSGGCLSIGNGFICWKFKKQTTLSTSEAELVAVHEMSGIFSIWNGFSLPKGARSFQRLSSKTTRASPTPSILNAHIGTKFFPLFTSPPKAP